MGLLVISNHSPSITFQTMTDATKIVQLLITKVLPWHSLQFLHIGIDFVEVVIAGIDFSFNINTEGELAIKRILCKAIECQQASDFAKHLIGVLNGKVRNDAGELVDSKVTR